MISLFRSLVLLLSMMFFCPPVAYASSINELLDANKLSVGIQVRANETQIVGQPLVIVIEVATDRWFAHGTQIEPFKLDGLIMLADSEISINGTKRINGTTWASQTRELTLYPTRAGLYALPEIGIQISVNTEKDGVVAGRVLTKIQEFTIVLPKELASVDQYVVSPLFEVAVEGAFSDKQYNVGEALTQIVTLTAQDTPAMMLPVINKPRIDGVSIYQKPSSVTDSSSRGLLVGTRVESFTYIFEQAGQYSIAKQVLYWWNSESHELVEIILPESHWTVIGGKSTTRSTDFFGGIDLKGWFISVILLLVGGLSVGFTFRYRCVILNYYRRLAKTEKRKIRKRFIIELSQEQYSKACETLFRLHDLPQTDIYGLKAFLVSSPDAIAGLEKLYWLAYGDKQVQVTGAQSASVQLTSTMTTSAKLTSVEIKALAQSLSYSCGKQEKTILRQCTALN